MGCARININPDKCKILISNRNGIVEGDFTLPYSNNVLKAIEKRETDEIFRYF